MYDILHYQSPLGAMTLAAEGGHLTGAWFDGQKYFPNGLPAAHGTPATPVLEQTRAWLDRYFRGAEPGPLPPLRPEGTSFRTAVWALLLQIPYGETRTYGQLARALARQLGRETMSAQAVGGAVGHNPISILVPCHRVVGSDGSLTGYAGGVERKIRLLALERADLSRLSIPEHGTAL